MRVTAIARVVHMTLVLTCMHTWPSNVPLICMESIPSLQQSPSLLSKSRQDCREPSRKHPSWPWVAKIKLSHSCYSLSAIPSKRGALPMWSSKVSRFLKSPQIIQSSMSIWDEVIDCQNPHLNCTLVGAYVLRICNQVSPTIIIYSNPHVPWSTTWLSHLVLIEICTFALAMITTEASQNVLSRSYQNVREHS